jgi:transposase
MERYLGLDVHRDSTTVCVLNEAGKEIRREVVETHSEALVGSLRQLAGNLHLCIEEGEWSQWLYEILSPHVVEMVCVHVEWRPGSKSDAIDAHGLAERLRVGKSGPLVFRTPSEFSKLRELARVYGCLTGDVVRSKNRLKALFRRRGVSCSGTGLYTPEGRRSRSRGLSTAYRPAVELLGWELDSLLELKSKAQKAMVDEAHRFKISRILETAPGLGPIRVAQMLPIVITPHRFRSKRQFWSYCGFGIVRRTSADWTQVGGRWVKGPVVQTRGLSRNHNRLLKAIFKSAATSSISLSGPNPLQHAYERLLEAGTKPNLAKLTIARKIAAIVLAMWKSEKEYEARS